MERRDLEGFEQGLRELGLALSERQVEQFLLYDKMLLEWNERTNLTAITEFGEVLEKHFIDSLCLAKVLPDSGRRCVLDVGTGAGFPGIPLKIVFPEWEFVLVDSVGKKLTFLNAVIHELGLFDVITVHGRAEDLAHERRYRERFDLCVSRAVADLAVLAEYSLPFVQIGGSFVAYKAKEAEDEVARARNAIFRMGGEMGQTVSYTLPNAREERTLICVRKERETPREYPRKAGIPKKNPL